MDQQTLERLVMDRELGELSADGADLLAAYLHDHPKDAAACDGFALALNDARRAVGARRGAAGLKKLDAARVSRALRIGDMKVVAARWRPLAVAAALAMAFLLGSATRTQPGDSARRTFAQSEQSGQPAPSETGEFWSIKRYITAPPRKASPTVIWTSPLAKPQLGETS
jgi:hypothetical protein